MKLEIKKSIGKLIASLHTFGATTKIDRKNLYALSLQFFSLFWGKFHSHDYR
jgi:hypothetical protein